MALYRLLEEERLRRLRERLGLAEPTEQNPFADFVPPDAATEPIVTTARGVPVQRISKDFKPETEETLQRRYFAEHPAAQPRSATGVGPPAEEFRPKPGRSFLEYLTNAEEQRMEQEALDAAVLGGALKGLVEPPTPEFLSSPLGALAFAPGAGVPMVGGPSMLMAKTAFGGLRAAAPGAVKSYVTTAARGPAAQAVVPVKQATAAGRKAPKKRFIAKPLTDDEVTHVTMSNEARRQALAAGQTEMPVATPSALSASVQAQLRAVKPEAREAQILAIQRGLQPPGQKIAMVKFLEDIGTTPSAEAAAKAPSTAVPARGQATEAVAPKAAKAAGVTEGVVPAEDNQLLMQIRRNEGAGIANGVRAFWERGIGTSEAHLSAESASIRLEGLTAEQIQTLQMLEKERLLEFVYKPEWPLSPYTEISIPRGTNKEIADEFGLISQRLSSPTTPSAAAGQGLPPPATAVPTRAGPSAVTQAAAPVSRSAVKTPAQATQRVKAIQQEGKNAPESILSKDAKEAHIESGAADGPRPPVPPRPVAKGAQPPPDDPDVIVRQIAEKATQGERPDQTLLRLHEAAIGSEARRNGIIVRDGNTKLKALGIGVMRRGQLIPKTQDITELDALYNVLHNPTKVASGEMQIPKGYEAIYRELRDLTDWEQAARLDFDPAMAMVDDYFYRGWKPPEGAFANVSQGRPLVKTPVFKKPRVDATYQEMRDAGFEPLFWNPYQQWGLSRMQGTKYREQMELVGYLKGMGDDFARPHVGGPIPEGWRVPEVGPAFEGKPFATLDAAGDPATMYTRRWIVPDRVANTLENIYGKRPDLGKLTIGAKSIDPLTVIDFLTFVPKRAKLMGSLFQQVDFLTRAGAGSWTRMVDALFAGQPIEAAKALARYPKTVVTIIQSNFSPGLRQSLARQLDSTVPLVKGRPGVHLKGISEAGLSTFDPAMFRWEQMDKVVREVAQETGVLGKGRNALRAVGDLESMMRRGLFEGVYPAAMVTDIRNNVAPMVARMYPKLNDAQLNGTIARIINKKYSSIPASQSVLQNRAMRETLRRVFFSIGESEGLLRQAASTVVGPNKKFWMKHWLGTYLFVIATASAIHFASTGKPLPKERFSPISKDKWGPLPFGYNTRFASPTIPFKGRGGSELTLDVVGQMDTALRVLNPGSFITSRESIPIRALVNQVSGTDYFGNPIDDVGPGGVVSRTVQLIQDLFSPIGLGGITSEVARRNIPGAEEVINEGETRLGMAGLAVQATGLNLRAATREQRLLSTLGPQAKKTLGDLDKLGLDLGYVTRNFDMKLGVKGGEITLTSEQREQLQWLTDDTVVAGLQKFFADPVFQRRSDEENKEKAKSNMEASRATARARFRTALKTQQVGQGQPTRPAPAQPVAPTPTGAPRVDYESFSKTYAVPTPVGVR